MQKKCADYYKLKSIFYFYLTEIFINYNKCVLVYTRMRPYTNYLQIMVKNYDEVTSISFHTKKKI